MISTVRRTKQEMWWYLEVYCTYGVDQSHSKGVGFELWPEGRALQQRGQQCDVCKRLTCSEAGTYQVVGEPLRQE